MKISLFFGLYLLFTGIAVHGQELYPYAEPASNMPSRSVSLKNTSIYHNDVHSSRVSQRYMPEVMVGINKAWMMHVGVNFSNMHQPKIIWEGGRIYAKYRFLSVDDVHKHFRMAAFGMAAYSKNHLDHNEINLMMGEQSGLQGGLIATQLWNRLALSGTVAWNEVLDETRRQKLFESRYAYQAVNYSLSAGYLLLPFEYKNYDQTNINLYVELLGSRNINFREKYYLDLAPSVQAIFGSTAKLSLGYRFQLSSDIYRLTKNSFMVNMEYLFLNALKRSK